MLSGAVFLYCSHLAFNQLTGFPLTSSFMLLHWSFLCCFRSLKWSNFKGMTTYGSFLLAMLITVAHWDGTKIDVHFFALSIAECIESASISEWPLSKNFWLIVSNLSFLFKAYNNADETNWFLFWPPQLSEYRVISFKLDAFSASLEIYMSKQLPISEDPRPPCNSSHR